MNLHSAGVVAGVPCHLRVEPWTFKQRCSSIRLNFSRTNTITTRISSLDSSGANEATKFIDEKLIDTLAQNPGVIRQIVLLTDGVDDRPYRLPWLPLTVIFQVSATSQVERKGKDVPKACLIRHVHAKLEDPTGWTESLRNAGFQGDKPSVWAMQGINHEQVDKLQTFVHGIGDLAMKGSLLIGDLSSNVIGSLDKDVIVELLEKTLMGCGFRLKTSSLGGCRILFVAEQLRLSGDQVNKVLREMELAEESGDEETFEDW